MENKTEKYFKYAIGEIVLVVIGIMIALQINNWNESRKDQKRIRTGLIELKSALESDFSSLEYLINEIETSDRAGKQLLNNLNKSADSIDLVQLFFNIYTSQMLGTFGSSSNSYVSLVNNGDIDLIKDNILKRRLGDYYNKFDWASTYEKGPLIKSYEEYIAYSHNFTQPNTLRLAYEAYFPIVDTLKVKYLKELGGQGLINTDQLDQVSSFMVVVDRLQTNRYIQITNYKRKKDDVQKLINLTRIEIE
tara:strand:+ start:18873 stop:19619 length:747 start_codon:yes stop_codon:yes gene_type:complete